MGKTAALFLLITFGPTLKGGAGRSLLLICPLTYGVPQWLVLCPMLLNTYMKLLSEIIRRFGLQYHQSTDDTQLCLMLPSDPKQAVPPPQVVSGGATVRANTSQSAQS